MSCEIMLPRPISEGLRPISSFRLLLLITSLISCRSGGLTTARGSLAVSPSAYDFGDVTVGTSTSTEIKLANFGQAKISISAIHFTRVASTAFRFDSPLPTSIEPGSSQTLVVRYAPTVAGGSSESVEIESDANNAPTSLISLVGYGFGFAANADAGGAAFDAGRTRDASVEGDSGSALYDAGRTRDASVEGDSGSALYDAGRTPDAGSTDAGLCVWSVELLAGNDQVVRPISDGTGANASIQLAQDLSFDPLLNEVVFRENVGPIRRLSQSGLVTTVSDGLISNSYCMGFDALGVSERGNAWCVSPDGFYRLDESVWPASWVRMADFSMNQFGYLDGAFVIAGSDGYSVTYDRGSDGGFFFIISRWPLDGGAGMVVTAAPGYLPRFARYDPLSQKIHFQTSESLGVLPHDYDLISGALSSGKNNSDTVLAFDRLGNIYTPNGRLHSDGGIDVRMPLSFRSKLAAIVVDSALNVYVSTVSYFAVGHSSAIYRLTGCVPK